jgi:hypothetical protein
MYEWCSLPKPGRFKCEKTIPQEFDERVYMVALDGNEFSSKKKKERIIVVFFSFSFLFCDTNARHDCSLYINYMENVSK